MDTKLLGLLLPGISLIIFGSINLALAGAIVPTNQGVAITNIGLGLIFLYEAARK